MRHSIALDDVREVRRAAGGTVNDVCPAVTAGALRRLSLARGEDPRPLKAMVPVNVRLDAESDALGTGSRSLS